MRSFTPLADTRFYAGVDLHARTLILVVIDSQGRTHFARNLPAAPKPFLVPSQLRLATAPGTKASRTGRGADPGTAALPTEPPESA
jgi:hypothetical protein